MTDQPLDLDALERDIAGMTPGPLKFNDGDGVHNGAYLYVGGTPSTQFRVLFRLERAKPDDAAGICALVNAAPALIAEVRRLRDIDTLYQAACEAVAKTACSGDTLAEVIDRLRTKLAEAEAALDGAFTFGWSEGYDAGYNGLCPTRVDHEHYQVAVLARFQAKRKGGSV
jgi:hypothetical protein